MVDDTPPVVDDPSMMERCTAPLGRYRPPPPKPSYDPTGFGVKMKYASGFWRRRPMGTMAEQYLAPNA